MLNQKRDLRFDVAKAILIILVVFGHTTRVGSSAEQITDFIRLIYVFHVSLFFFISGYFVSLDKLSLRRIFVHLVIPYAGAGIAYYAADAVMGGGAKAIIPWLIGAVTHGVGGASWFLCALIWMNLILLVFKWTRRIPCLCLLTTSVSLIGFIGLFHFDDAKLLFAGELCFLMGVLLHGQKIADVLCKVSLVAFGLFLGLNVCRWYHVPFSESIACEWLIRFLAMSSILGISALLLHNKVIGNVLCYIGQSTMIIFLIHSLFNHAWFPILVRVCSFDRTGIVYAILNTIVVIGTCLVVKEVFNVAKKILHWR